MVFGQSSAAYLELQHEMVELYATSLSEGIDMVCA